MSIKSKFLFMCIAIHCHSAYGQVQTQQVGYGDRYSKAYKQARISVKQFKKNHKVKLEASYQRVKARMLDKISAKADKGFTTHEHKLSDNEEKASYIIEMAKADKDFNGFYFQEFGLVGEENNGIKITWPHDVPDETETPTLPVEPDDPETPAP